MKVILLTSLGVGNYISFNLLYLAIIFFTGYYSATFSDYFLLKLIPFGWVLLGVADLASWLLLLSMIFSVVDSSLSDYSSSSNMSS